MTTTERPSAPVSDDMSGPDVVETRAGLGGQEPPAGWRRSVLVVLVAAGAYTLLSVLFL
jgi:hypothetical protein